MPRSLINAKEEAKAKREQILKELKDQFDQPEEAPKSWDITELELKKKTSDYIVSVFASLGRFKILHEGIHLDYGRDDPQTLFDFFPWKY